MKTLRTLFWFAFFSLLWARIGVSIDHHVGDRWVSLIAGWLCSVMITAAALLFVGAWATQRRLRRERLLSLQRRMNEDTAAAQRLAEDSFKLRATGFQFRVTP